MSGLIALRMSIRFAVGVRGDPVAEKQWLPMFLGGVMKPANPERVLSMASSGSSFSTSENSEGAPERCDHSKSVSLSTVEPCESNRKVSGPPALRDSERELPSKDEERQRLEEVAEGGSELNLEKKDPQRPKDATMSLCGCKLLASIEVDLLFAMAGIETLRSKL